MSLLSAYSGKAANSVCVYSVPLLDLVMLDLIHNLVTYPPLKSPTVNCNLEHILYLAAPESDKVGFSYFKPIPRKAVKTRGIGSL